MNEPRPAPATHPTSAPRRRWLRLGVAAAALALLGAGGWTAWRLWGGGAPKAEQHILATVQRGDIEDLVSATGSLQPRDYVDVGAQVSGQVKRIAVEVGSEVQAGELLVEIDAETSAARVDASRAQLRSQQAQLAERELNVVKAERDLQRQKNLMAEDATTAETLQNAETAMRTAKVQVQSLKAQIEQLQASMRVEEANLKFTRIYAPIAGTVVSITARQGQTLNANQSAPTLLRIADLSTMTVQTQVSEADVSKLRAGMPVYFTTLGSQTRRWTGQLKKVEPTPTVTNNVVLYNALFDVPNANRSLMTQMTAQVFFIAAEARDVLMVPVAALTMQRGGGGGRRERGAAGAAGSGGAASAAPVVVPASAARRVADAPAAAAPAASSPRRRGPGAGGAAGERGERPGFDREAWQQMSEEQRERLRAERRAAREAAGGAGAGADAGPRGAPRAERAAGDAPREPRAARAPGNATGATDAARAGRAVGAKPNAAPAAGAQAQAQAQAPAQAEAPAPRRAPRRATVKVVAADGSVQEREVTVGISNRVQAEILSGLQEGEKVIVGTRQPETARRAGSGQGAAPGVPGGPGLGGLGGTGTGAAPAGAGRGR